MRGKWAMSGVSLLAGVLLGLSLSTGLVEQHSVVVTDEESLSEVTRRVQAGWVVTGSAPVIGNAHAVQLQRHRLSIR